MTTKQQKRLETTIEAYRHDLELELPPRLAEVENILHKLEFRGMDFFDRTFRLTNIHHLIRGDAVRAAFEKEVLADVPGQIDGQVQKLIEWLVEKRPARVAAGDDLSAAPSGCAC